MNNSAKQIAVTEILSIAKKAGEAIMKIYEKDFSVEYKDDKSPLTEADTVSNKIIVEALANYTPDIPVISEENKLTEYEVRSKWDLFWLIDPIDGTKEFIKKNGEFTVNIALIENGIPVLGVVYVPAQKVTFYGMKDDGSFKVTESGVEKLYPGEHYSKKQSVIVVGSRSHLSDETLEFVEQLKKSGKDVEFKSSGSSLKLCLVAEGSADVYPRFGPTMEWDTAAAHAVALYAGKSVVNYETGKPLTYNKENLLNPYFIVE